MPVALVLDDLLEEIRDYEPGGGVLDISLGGEVRRIPIFDTLFKSTEVIIN